MLNSNERITFAGKLAGPPVSKWEQSARDYRKQMYSTYKAMCKKRGTDAMSKDCFVAHGLAAHGTAKPRKAAGFWGWLAW